MLFRSRRYSHSDPDQLFTVQVSGGFPSELPLPHYQRPPWRSYHPKLPPLPERPSSVSGNH